jgi:glutamine synthetase
MSVYLGDQLEKVFEEIKTGKLTGCTNGGEMDLGLSQILNFERDPGDRNRTSPFAFTGNRFEFRAVGSSQSVSGPLVAMNTMLADSLSWIAEKLEAALTTQDQTAAVISVLKELMELHGNAVFGGDGYSAEWHKAAVEERGLLNIPTTADALPHLMSPEIVQLFESTGVLSPVELESRYEVYAEQYNLAIEVEAKLASDIAKTKIYPAAISYLSELSHAASSVAGLGIELDATVTKAIAEHANGLLAAATQLEAEVEKHDFADAEAHMRHSADVLCPLMAEAREHGDALEMLVADELWPLPKYSEMLFIK